MNLQYTLGNTQQTQTRFPWGGGGQYIIHIYVDHKYRILVIKE